MRAELPGLNMLVANAGSGAVVPFLDLTIEAWDATLALNLTGTFLCMQEAARIMVEMPEGVEPGDGRGVVDPGASASGRDWPPTPRPRRP